MAPLRSRFAKPVVFLLALVPALWLLWALPAGALGANPIEATVRHLGDWALRMLLIALAVTPVRRLTGWAEVMRFRRMLGLFAFFYAALHLMAYVGLDQFFAWGAIWADVVKRVYITVGMAAFAILLALALTSPKAAVRRLGGRTWRRLHRLVYPAAILAVAHHALMVKADYFEPVVHGAILLLLLVMRLPRSRPMTV